MTLQIDRFEAKVEEKGVQFKIDGKGIVTIKDHSTDEIIAMVNLDSDGNTNLEIADKVIEAIENWIVENEN